MLKSIILLFFVLVILMGTILSQTVPFKGREQGSNYMVSFNPATGEMVIALEGTGNATQVGNYNISGQAVVNVFTNEADISATLTAANGDELFLDVNPNLQIIDEHNVMTNGTIEGGTGRFSGATGEWEFRFVYDLPYGTLPNTYTGSLTGTINKNKSMQKISGDEGLIIDYELSQNYPNPFNPSTVIGYQLPVNGNVTLKVYDLVGREVATLVNEFKPTGSYEVEFNASELSSGTYIYRLQAGDPSAGSGHGFVEMKKLILIK